MTNNKFYQYSSEEPYHVSVGAILFNDSFEICLHRFTTSEMPERLQFLAGGLDEYYHLVRETLEGNESLHDAVLRGVYEEFGADGVVEKYLGSKIDIVETPTTEFEKLTMYHSVKLTELGERPKIDEENETIMEWHSPQSALEIYKTQASKTTRPELDETVIIKRFIEAYSL